MNTLPINPDDSPAFLTELVFRLKIKDAMTQELFTARRTDSLRRIQLIMKEHQITGVPIAERTLKTEGPRLLGIVSMDDIIRALDEGLIDEPAERHMTRQLIVLEDDMPLSFGISYMDKYRFGRFPVLNKNKELVGIITSRDILVALLVEFNKEAERREDEEPERGTEDSFRREYRVRKFDFEHAGKPTSEIKKKLKQIGLHSRFIRRVAVACYELEMNQVVHSEGGTIAVRLSPELVEIIAIDNGPGIPDVEQALVEGYSTATEWIRSLGFGAGMGLPNAQRVSDEFEISSGSHGTSVRCRFKLPQLGDEDEAQ
ncbi:MAG: CBS domain-containing protein [Spirochaetota bacterium]